MKELCLEVFSAVSPRSTCSVPLETLIVMFVYEYCKKPPMRITLVQSTALINRAHYSIKLQKIRYTLTNEYELSMPANLCKLPVIVTDGSLVISGLCSVLRHIIQTVNEKHPLLGFKQGCLNACTETSVWTKFCEIDIVKTVDDLYYRDEWGNEPVLLPRDVARFEKHMGKPVKAHNIQKQKQDLARKEGYFNKNRSRPPDARLDIIKDLDHTFSEGHNMSLADLILFPCMHLIFQLLGVPETKNEIPLTYKWYETMLEIDGVSDAMDFMRVYYRLPEGIKYELPYVSDMSLYRCEKKQNYKSLYANQYVMNNSLELLANIQRHLEINKRTFAHDQKFKWSYVPFSIQLAGRDFPIERCQRKARQLENMIKAVLRLAQNGYRIVEFCAGSGYLGLVLAYCLPSCKIILVENKEESLRRAKELAVKSKLTNITFCQGNIDYFQGHFNVGVSLHACGIATDLVIEKCLYRKASFICCPCCYGSIEPNDMIKYPRSKVFKDAELSSSDYFTMSHAADKPHVEGEDKAKSGKTFMNIIDADRCLRAMEYNYSVHLSTLEPSSCSPKNNLLVGIPK